MKDRILLWNDDNHEPCVWINRNFIGVDLTTILENTLLEQPISNIKSEILELYPWDFEDSEDLEDGEGEIIFDWFQSMPNINEIQWEYIFNREWNKLEKTL